MTTWLGLSLHTQMPLVEVHQHLLHLPAEIYQLHNSYSSRSNLISRPCDLDCLQRDIHQQLSNTGMSRLHVIIIALPVSKKARCLSGTPKTSIQSRPNRCRSVGCLGSRWKHTNVLFCFPDVLSLKMIACLPGAISTGVVSSSSSTFSLGNYTWAWWLNMMQGSVRFSSLSFLGQVPPLTSSRRSPSVLICNHAKAKCFTAGYWHNFILHEIIFHVTG